MIGHSGCKLELSHDMVYKSTNNNYPKHRLQAQYEKQKWFYANSPLDSTWNVPRVLGTRKDDDKNFTFIMDFIPFNDDLGLAKPRERTWLKNVILSFIQWEMEQCCKQTILADYFREKVKKVKTFLTADYQWIADKIESMLHDVIVPVGVCHGDLTFENILVSFSGREVIIIDFLDSYLDSPFVDIVKLRQDTYHKWIIKQDDTCKAWETLEYIDKFLKPLIPQDTFKMLDIINLYRMIPYIKKKSELELVLEEIRNV